MSCGSQGSTVQGSSPYKCGKKSSCSAFNAVAVALSQIFPSSYSSSMFAMLAPRSRVSWKVTLSDRACIRSTLGLSEEIFLLRTPFHWNITFVDFELNTLTTVYSSSNQSTSSDKVQGPIYDFRPLSLQYIYIYMCVCVCVCIYCFACSFWGRRLGWVKNKTVLSTSFKINNKI